MTCNPTSRPVLRCVATLLFVIGGAAVPLFSRDTSEAEILTRLFEAGAQELSYTSQFEAALSVDQLQQLLGQIENQLGAFAAVEGSANPYTVVFEEGTSTAYITLDGEARVAGLQFTEMNPASGSLDDALERVQNIEGQTSLLVRRDGETRRAIDEDKTLAVGSSFRLAVLAAVVDAIDDSATDALISPVGCEAVELADLIERLDHLDLMTVNPGLASRTDWKRVAYKGDGEPGVLNLTTALADSKGTRHTVSLTVNRDTAPLDEPHIYAAYQAILNAL